MVETEEPEATAGDTSGKRPGFSWRRLAPLAVILIAMAAIFASGWHDFLPRLIADSRETLQSFVRYHMPESIGLFILTYVVVVALSLPVAAMLTVLGGFLFGPLLSGTIVVFAATIGATLIFLAARTALGDFLAAHSGRVIEKMRKGFQDNAFSYMLFLRLVPAFPFALVNVAPAFLGVSLRTYVIGTFIGIIPGTFAYAFVGGGLDSILVKAKNDPEFQACMAKEAAGTVPEGSCPLGLDLGDFITTELILAFVLMGVVALIPAIWRMARRRPATKQ